MPKRKNSSSPKKTQGSAREPMTVQEAGRKGGEAVKEKYGPSFYKEIGHAGGQRVKQLIDQAKRGEDSDGFATEELLQSESMWLEEEED